MSPEPSFVLVHSLALGPSSWQPVAERLRAAGHTVAVPSLLAVASGEPPFWPRAVEAVRRALEAAGPLVLVGHSNSGLLLPVLSADLGRPIEAAVFVDAALPAPADATPTATPERLAALRDLAVDGVLPRWTDWWPDDQVADLFPDSTTRERVVAEQPTLPLSYYEQRIPVPAGWADGLCCSYLQFSAAYADAAAEARGRGWQVARLPGRHLHQLFDPAAVARRIAELAD